MGRHDAGSGIDGTKGVLTWAVAAAVAGAALLGLSILVSLVVIALQPPGWVQTALGAALAFGTALFAWLIATALRSRDLEQAPHLVATSLVGRQTRKRRTA